MHYKKNGIFNTYTFNFRSIKTGIKIPTLPNEKVNIELPDKLPENLSDIFFQINYLGGSADAFLNNKKVTDHLFHDLPGYSG